MVVLQVWQLVDLLRVKKQRGGAWIFLLLWVEGDCWPGSELLEGGRGGGEAWQEGGHRPNHLFDLRKG